MIAHTQDTELTETLSKEVTSLQLRLSRAMYLIDKLIDSEYNHYEPENFSEEEKEVLRDAIDFFNNHKPAKDKRKNYLI